MLDAAATSHKVLEPARALVAQTDVLICGSGFAPIEKLKKDRAFYIGMPLNVERLEATWVRALAVEEIQATAYASYTYPSRAYRVHGCRSPIPYPPSSARFNHSRNLGNPSSGRMPSSAASQGPGSYSTWQ